MSVTITARTVKSGRRFIVRYRLGGRAFQQHHAGSFPTRKEAEARRDIIAGEIAHGRDPQSSLLRSLANDSPVRQTFAIVAERYRVSRVDASEKTRTNLKSHMTQLNQTFGTRDPNAIRWQEVQEWVSAQTMKPRSVEKYTQTLKQVLDYAGCDPNPARDQRIRLPKHLHEQLEPPSLRDVTLILEHCAPRHRLALETLTATGMRCGELYDLQWRDVDESAARFRVRDGKTAAARRWVAVPAEVMTAVAASTPEDDRVAERRVFPLATGPALRGAITKACRNAKIAAYSPHDLRHRYASVQIARGVPAPSVAAQLGHTKISMTLDTYSHVLLDE